MYKYKNYKEAFKIERLQFWTDVFEYTMHESKNKDVEECAKRADTALEIFDKNFKKG